MKEMKDTIRDIEVILDKLEIQLGQRASPDASLALICAQENLNHAKSELIRQYNTGSVEEKTGEKVGIGVHHDNKFFPVK